MDVGEVIRLWGITPPSKNDSHFGFSLSRAYYFRGEAYFGKGSYDRAIADYSDAFRLHTSDDIPRELYFTVRGHAYAKRGDYDHAVADYTEAIRISPNITMIMAAVGRGQAWEAKSQPTKAIEDYNKALGLDAFRDEERDAQALARVRLAALQTAPPVAAPEPKPPTTAPVTGTPPAIRLGRRVALVIGNAAYLKWSALGNPGKDAAAVAAALEKQLGFEKVILKLDLTEKGFKAALIEFAQVAAGADLGLIYYAGHGMEAGGRNFLIPVDAEPPTPASLDLHAIPLDAVMRRLDGVSRLRLVVLDACRSNPFDRSPGGGGRGLKAIEPEDNTLVVYAAKAGTTAADDAGLGHSPFTQAFLQHVTRPGIEVRQLFGYVRDETLKLTRRVQQPWTYGTLGGDPLYLHVKQ
jgi:hypothetical protein